MTMELTQAEAATIPNLILVEAKDLTPGNLLADPDGGDPHVVDSVSTAYGNVTVYAYSTDGWEWDETHEGETEFVLASRGDQDAFFKMRNQAACGRQDRDRLYAEYIAAHTPAILPDFTAFRR